MSELAKYIEINGGRVLRVGQREEVHMHGDEEAFLEDVSEMPTEEARALLLRFEQAGSLALKESPDVIVPDKTDAEATNADAPDASSTDEDGTLLPEDTPFRSRLVDNGLKTVEAVLSHDDLSEIKYISDDRRDEIIDALTENA